MREIIDFNRGWLFHKGDLASKYPPYKGVAYMSAKTERKLIGPAARNYYASADSYSLQHEHKTEEWESVDLPHDFVIGGEIDKHENCALGFFKYDNAWYIKHFRLEKADENKRLVLYFEGIATHSVVYLNGCPVARSFSGYTPIEADITDFALFGEDNVLAVYVNTEEHEGWWYEGGGIYRGVTLVKTDRLSAERDGVCVRPEPSVPGEFSGAWRVPVSAEIRNDNAENRRVRIEFSILTKSGEEAAKKEVPGSLQGKSVRGISAELRVENPALWSPETPYLYDLRVRVYAGRETEPRDEYVVPFGFRAFTLDKDRGLFINGKHYKIKGVCGHADCGLFGKAVPENIHRYKVRLMKEMGANGYRTSHYMQSAALMDALDENGFIVMDETRWFDSSEEGIVELKKLVRRDRNRPSVFFWSIGNEEVEFHAEARGKKIAERMIAEIRRLDPTRPVTTALSCPNADLPVNEVVDAIGINYHWNLFDKTRELYPDKPIISSENCAVGTTRGWYYEKDDTRGYLPAYDPEEPNYDPVAPLAGAVAYGREQTWKFIASREWIAGGYQWIAFEHRGEAIYPRLCSQSGAIDLYLQKKDAFWQNLSHWSDKPVLHLLPHWNFAGREGEPIRVCAYTNLPRAELFLNGASLGVKDVEKYGHAEWIVPYAAGELKVCGYGADGAEVLMDVRRTTGAPVRLALICDTNAEETRGGDTAIFTCVALDRDGNEVPNAVPTVSFLAEGCGKVVATGSSVCDHVSVFAVERKMYAGRITAAVKLNKKGGALRVRAFAEGLLPAVYSADIEEKN